MNEFEHLKVFDSLQSFFTSAPDRVYRFWVYKNTFTPHEQEMKYSDQSVFEDTCAQFGLIREVIYLPDGDVLLGFVTICESVAEIFEDNRRMAYYKLSEIRLNYMPSDDQEFADGSCIGDTTD